MTRRLAPGLVLLAVLIGIPWACTAVVNALVGATP